MLKTIISSYINACKQIILGKATKCRSNSVQSRRRTRKHKMTIFKVYKTLRASLFFADRKKIHRTSERLRSTTRVVIYLFFFHHLIYSQSEKSN